MTNQPTPETDAKLAAVTEDSSATHSSTSDWPEYARALEIQRNAAREDLEEWRFHKASWGTSPASVRMHIKQLSRELEEANAKIEAFRDVAILAAERDKARADSERFRAALELIAAPMRLDGVYNRDRAACGCIARAALDSLAN